MIDREELSQLLASLNKPDQVMHISATSKSRQFALSPDHGLARQKGEGGGEPTPEEIEWIFDEADKAI